MARCRPLIFILAIFLGFLCTFTHSKSIEGHQTDKLSIKLDKYYHYDDLTELLQKYAKDHPKITKLHSVGKSVQGRNLWAIQITSNINQKTPGKPQFKYVGNMHGNEVVSRQILAYLINYLLENYGTNNVVTKLVNSTDIYIMPSMNPDGFEASIIGDCQGVQGRRNAKNVDLNRNFPDQFSKRGKDNALQKETQLMMNWITNNRFVLSANLHGGSVVASYPFDDSPVHKEQGVYSGSPDDKFFKQVAIVYSSNHGTMHKGNVCQGDHFTDGITNGAFWYDVPGGMQDFNYLNGNCFEITIELSCCKYPQTPQLPTEWKNNKDSLIAYMQQVHKGITGFVKDEKSGKGIKDVLISVKGINKTVETADFGDYWRLLVPGTYSITFSKKGYVSKTVNNVKVTSGDATKQDVILTKESNYVHAVLPFERSSTIVIVLDWPDGKNIQDLNNVGIIVIDTSLILVSKHACILTAFASILIFFFVVFFGGRLSVSIALTLLAWFIVKK